MIEVEGESESGGAVQVGSPRPDSTLVTVKVYTCHKRTCPKRDRPDWAGCNCVKWRTFTATARTHRSAQRRAAGKGLNRRRVNSGTLFDPTSQLQRQLEAKMNSRNGQVEITLAADQLLEGSRTPESCQVHPRPGAL